ncbi:Hypothetical protein R9X50_00271700 [Acrodontium crateriforme]|uniref:Bud emergence protein 1 n=1 Tax=Acrodontium crateriforme TaxID=150365 RepID=A0AAQ3M225_9PEZI|nr:Hypothetical protein R9X50_00271700 [Acrodontium crateriforme]
MKFRRSMKNEKHDSAKPVQITIPQKDAIAIEPPKKVIKALYDYNAPPADDSMKCLSFSAGDFLHVVGRENSTDWYEACNPLVGSRGMVPVKYFEDVGKTVRDSGDSSNAMHVSHDSGYDDAGAGRGAGPGRTSNMTSASAPGIPAMPGHRSSNSITRAMGGVYGVVSYDFNAERPDELDAKEGEAIIVIAQSNPEWFVAKPITRLGGPGLIPVSFIEIRDMVTGKAVENPLEAVQKAGIPKVEEWKKMAAEYKNTSIPLGTVSSSQQGNNLQQSMERMSLSNGGQNGGHQRQPSNFQQQQQHNLFTPERASVPRYIYADDKFHFIVECRLSNGAHWDLSRVYEDFYELQINLINAFPEEAGQAGKSRILPYMPGPVKYVTDNISEGRRSSLDEYLRDLLRLPQKITGSSLVRNFFSPREGDYEVDPAAVDVDSHARPSETRDDRYSANSQGSNGTYHQQRQPSQSSIQPYGQSIASNDGFGQSNAPPGHYRSGSQMTHLTQLSQSNTISQTMTQQSGDTLNTTSTNTAPVKVKAWFDRDTCVVIRMPSRGQFGFEELYRKIVERRRLEFKTQDQEPDNLDIEYRDEKDGEYYRLEGDEDLDIALERNEKLTLAVRAAE